MATRRLWEHADNERVFNEKGRATYLPELEQVQYELQVLVGDLRQMARVHCVDNCRAAWE